MVNYYFTDELYHHGVKGMKWGVRRNREKANRDYKLYNSLNPVQKDKNKKFKVKNDNQITKKNNPTISRFQTHSEDIKGKKGYYYETTYDLKRKTAVGEKYLMKTLSGGLGAKKVKSLKLTEKDYQKVEELLNTKKPKRKFATKQQRAEAKHKKMIRRASKYGVESTIDNKGKLHQYDPESGDRWIVY